MKKVLYASILFLVVFAGCKKKTTPDPTPTPTPDPAPTMNYIKFTLNGPGITNKTFIYSKAKNFVQTYEYSETTSSVIYASLDMADKSTGDTLVQIRLDDKNTGNKPFSTSAVFVKLVNIKTGFQSSSTIGSFQVSAFTPTQLSTNGTSGTQKGKFSIAATFSGTLEEDNTGETWTMTNGEVKFDGL
jgi:hypothetical protein